NPLQMGSAHSKSIRNTPTFDHLIVAYVRMYICMRMRHCTHLHFACCCVISRAVRRVVEWLYVCAPTRTTHTYACVVMRLAICCGCYPSTLVNKLLLISPSRIHSCIAILWSLHLPAVQRTLTCNTRPAYTTHQTVHFPPVSQVFVNRM